MKLPFSFDQNVDSFDEGRAKNLGLGFGGRALTTTACGRTLLQLQKELFRQDNCAWRPLTPLKTTCK